MQQAEAVLALKQKQQDALDVRAGINGVLVPTRPSGGRARGSRHELAKVVQPDQLKAA